MGSASVTGSSSASTSPAASSTTGTASATSSAPTGSEFSAGTSSPLPSSPAALSASEAAFWSSTAGPRMAWGPEELEAAATSAVSEAVRQLPQNGSVGLFPEFTVLARSLGSATTLSGGGSLVNWTEFNVAAVVPASALRALGAERHDVALALTIPKTWRSQGVFGALGADLVNRSDGRVVEVEALPEPITLWLPTEHMPGMACAFWDGGKWSQEGMRELSAPGGPLVCETRHFTVFAGVWAGFRATYECSQVALMSLKSLQAVARGDWHRQAGAWLFWCVLFVMIATFTVAAVIDCRRARWFSWRPEFFLVPLREQPMELEKEAPQGSICGCTKSTAKNLIDEILAEWFVYFSDLRSLCEELLSGMDLRCRDCRMLRPSRRLTTKLLVNSTRRLVGAATGVNDEVVTFVLEDQDFYEYISGKQEPRDEENSEVSDLEHSMAMQEVKRPPLGFRGGERNDSWRTATTREEAWIALHKEISERLPGQVARHAWRSVPKMALELFWNCNPISSTFQLNIFSSCKLRAFFFVVEVSGSLLVTSLFFTATGHVKGRARTESDCPDQELQRQLSFKVGRVLAVATGAVLLSWAPVVLLQSLQTMGFRKVDYEGCPEWRTQLRTWAMQDRIVWSLGGLYVLFCLGFTVMFLANVDNKDHAGFSTSCVLSFLQDTVVLPLGLSLCLPSLARLLMGCTIKRLGQNERVKLVQSVYKHIYDKPLPPKVKV